MRRNNNEYEVKDILTVVEVLKGLVVAVVFFLLIGAAGYVENHYNKKDCVVVEVCEDYAVAEDTRGNQWSWYITEDSDVVVGDVVTLHMFTGYTDNTADDDEVVNVWEQM